MYKASGLLTLLVSGAESSTPRSATPLMAEIIALTTKALPTRRRSAHRHAAHAFLYVPEGSIAMDVNGDKEVTLRAGPDPLRRAERHPYSRSYCQQDPADQVPGGLVEEQGSAGSDTGLMSDRSA